MDGPLTTHRILAALRRRARRRPVRLGSFDRPRPISDQWGFDRGTPVDRWYIERFLQEHRADITGRVLEVKDSGYTDRYGHGVTERGVLDIDPGNDAATYVADLAAADAIPAGRFDCFVLTQTLQYVFEPRAALVHARRILRPGGVLLATLPVVSRVTEAPLTDYWRFTPLSAARLFEELFGSTGVQIWARGNVLSSIAFLEGLAARELGPERLEPDDARFPLVVCIRARKAAG